MEDFFWTGSGDGPAAPERAAILASASGQVRPEAATSIATPAGTKTIVSTTTLLATLYLEPPGTNNATIQVRKILQVKHTRDKFNMKFTATEHTMHA